jgi:hypothetical protein
VNRNDYMHLLAERTALQRMIADTPKANVIDRRSLQSRLETLDETIAAAQVDERAPAQVRVTFNGRPVIGSQGIFAEFGMKAVNGLTEAVAAVAASLSSPLASSGPIPNREQYQLLITNTAVGSFGFELEEYRTGQLPLVGESPVAQALSRTQDLLFGSVGSDDELADSAAETDPRALDRVRAFLQTLADHEAVCAVQYRNRVFRFSDVGQVRRSITRLSSDNLREDERFLEGAFLGVLPLSRTFEFQLAGAAESIRGKISATIQHAIDANAHVGQATRIRVIETKVGNGRPRYTLLEMPTWPDEMQEDANRVR